MHPLVKLAKETVEKFVLEGEAAQIPADISSEMKERAGVFVSIKKNGELRGCIGTFSPCTKNVACEIMQNAVCAAVQDPRFPPVSPEELNALEYSVDVLTEPEKVSSRKELDANKYGVIVKSGECRGLLLPDLEGVDTVDEQICIAAMKAGIHPSEKMELYRFEVKRYK